MGGAGEGTGGGRRRYVHRKPEQRFPEETADLANCGSYGIGGVCARLGETISAVGEAGARCGGERRGRGRELGAVGLVMKMERVGGGRGEGRGRGRYRQFCVSGVC